MVPKAGESMEFTGTPRLVWFNALKNSDRICRRRVSTDPNENDLDIARSMSLSPGARKMLRPASPYSGVDGITKAPVLNHSLMDCWPEGRAPLATRFGRQLSPCAWMSAQDISTLNGVPLCAVNIPLNRHPPRAPFTSSLARDRSAGPRPNGISHTRLPTNTCGRSKLESPRSKFVLSGSCGYWPLAIAVSVPLLWLSIDFDHVYEPRKYRPLEKRFSIFDCSP